MHSLNRREFEDGRRGSPRQTAEIGVAYLQKLGYSFQPRQQSLYHGGHGGRGNLL